jgi:hypothetical protein
MGAWIGIVVIGLFLVWLLGLGKRRPIAPEDDVETLVDQDELADAEREIKDDPTAKPAADAVADDDDDWGPGTGHSPVPGVLP